MGEFADYALEETENAEFDRFLYRTGAIHPADAYEMGIIDERGFEYTAFTGRYLGYSKTKSCKFCGAAGFKWGNRDGTWRLVNPEGEIHRCTAYKR